MIPHILERGQLLVVTMLVLLLRRSVQAGCNNSAPLLAALHLGDFCSQRSPLRNTNSFRLRINMHLSNGM